MANVTNASEIPWKRITVEAVAIVGSILLAFAIDTWWDDRQGCGGVCHRGVAVDRNGSHDLSRVRFMPSGVISKAHAPIRMIGQLMRMSAVTKVTVHSGSFSAGKTVAAIWISSHATMAFTPTVLELTSSSERP